MLSTYVFDAYGTLFDVHAAVRRNADAVGPDHARLSEMWRAKQIEYTWIRTMSDRYMDFWELTQQALDYAFAKFPDANRNARKALLDAYWELDCFPEVPAVLKSLKDAGAQTGILSNGSTGMLEAAIKSAGLSRIIDKSISVDRIGIFKTVPTVYQMVLDDFGGTADAVSFQSSNRWDVAASSVFGFRTVWCNRGEQPDEYTDMAPAMVVHDLNGLIGKDGKPV